MRGKRSGYREYDYTLDDDMTLSPFVPDKNTEAADKKIQYEFETFYSAHKYKWVIRGEHWIQVTEPEDGLVTVYCTWFV